MVISVSGTKQASAERPRSWSFLVENQLGTTKNEVVLRRPEPRSYKLYKRTSVHVQYVYVRMNDLH